MENIDENKLILEKEVFTREEIEKRMKDVSLKKIKKVIGHK
jgi:hypothetical protein